MKKQNTNEMKVLRAILGKQIIMDKVNNILRNGGRCQMRKEKKKEMKRAHAAYVRI